MPNHFTLRAECQVDVDRLIEAIHASPSTPASTAITSKAVDAGEPDQLVDIETSLGKEDLIRLMRGVPDSHLMVRTLEDVTALRNTAVESPKEVDSGRDVRSFLQEQVKGMNGMTTETALAADWSAVYNALVEARKHLQRDGVRHSWIDSSIGIAEARSKNPVPDAYLRRDALHLDIDSMPVNSSEQPDDRISIENVYRVRIEFKHPPIRQASIPDGDDFELEYAWRDRVQALMHKLHEVANDYADSVKTCDGIDVVGLDPYVIAEFGDKTTALTTGRLICEAIEAHGGSVVPVESEDLAETRHPFPRG